MSEAEPMRSYTGEVAAAAEFLKSRTESRPDVGFLTGTGLGNSTASIQADQVISYADIPHFPLSTVQSHHGELVMGSLDGRPVMAMKGRFHLYEGYSPRQVTFPIRVMQMMGVRYLILTNASGGIAPGFSRGDIMVIQDHINLTGQNPLTGPNTDAWGERFPDMTCVYDPGLSTLARQIAAAESIPLQTGVYAGLPGPSLETPAETRYLQRIGCDAVGFSTVMEAIAGVHAGMKILALAAITNINDPDAPEKASVPDIIRTAEAVSATIGTLVSGVIRHLPPPAHHG